jgi:hypothetical protein
LNISKAIKAAEIISPKARPGRMREARLRKGEEEWEGENSMGYSFQSETGNHIIEQTF